jgi:hypothetical protein
MKSAATSIHQSDGAGQPESQDSSGLAASADDAPADAARAITALWEVRVWWRAVDGVTCPEFTTFRVEDETKAIDEAVSTMDGCRHRRALVTAVRAEIRPYLSEGKWRVVAAGCVRSYL